MSGKSIGFLDPHKVCFNNDYSGKEYTVKTKLLEGEIRDQFEPFKGVFDFDFQKEYYKSTLFRFPLRTSPSRLSHTKYTKDKVDKLFESLEEEASIILLFMKNIQHISVYERLSDADSVKRIFEVEIAPEKRESVEQERQRMMNAVERSCADGTVQDLESESSYVVDACFVNSQCKKSFRWLVLNQIGLEGHKRITELSQKLSLPAWVGCAVPLNEDAQKENSGRIFCFLPLPRDVDCQTGLPVLVHGAFGVTDNRRGLLWPGSECQNNKTAEWNVLLVEKILTSVIYNAVKSLVTDVPVTDLDEKQRRELVYSTVPKPDSVVGHWKCVLRPLFENLKHLNMFHAHSSEGTSWITLGQGLLDQMKQDGVLEETREAVLETLLKNSQVIIKDLPDHLCKTVKKYFGDRRDITPDFVRNFLRNQSIQTASHDDKLLLLQYVLHDNPQPEELSDIPLLPLASGEFATFTKHRHISEPFVSVFVPKDSCTEDLLPNMEDRFLKKHDGRSFLKETWRFSYQKLLAMATNSLDEVNPTQLVSLTPELVIECLRLSLPDEWFNTRNLKDIVSWKPSYPSHPPEKWINDIWHWINGTFESLEQFENIPLIPLESNSGKAFGVLSKNSRFIFTSDSSQNMHLSSKVVGLLEAAGCIVLPCTSTLLHVRHPDISSYIASPVSAEVAKMLSKSSMECAKEYIKKCSRDERKEIQRFFASSQVFSEEEKSVVLRLPLLDTLNGAFTAAIVNEQSLSVASSKFKLPSGFNFLKASQIISSAEFESSKLVHLLDLETIEPADIFCQFLFPDIQQEQYSREETTKIMIWILERKCEIQNPQFLNEIRKLSFVSTRNGELKSPSELYDPNDPILADLFLGEDNKFPSEKFSKMVSTLVELGLRSKEMITSSDLYGVAERINSSDYCDALKKVQALVTIFQQTRKFLHSDLTHHLAELKWLPRAMKFSPGMDYPKLMHNEWYSSDVLFYKPKELFRESHALLVGTSAPILGIEMNDKVQTSLGVQQDVNVNIVMGHLMNAVSAWEEFEKKLSNAQFNEMVKQIYAYLSKQPYKEVSEVIEQHSLVNWIWHGAGFCSPKQIALEKDLPFEFRPPLFLLPEMLNDGEVLTSFFKTCGVREQFSKEDIILVLADIKEAHEEPSQNMTLKHIEKDLKFCRSVLEWLVNDGQRLSEELRERVFVPVQNVENKLVLKECDKCTYCDQDWLKHGKSDLDIPHDFHLIHESIPSKLAPLLGVPSLSSCLLSADSIEFEQTGPYEPITTRIKNILKEYKEGVGIFKELIQNADDAGASTVKFLVDWRQGKTNSLFSPDMASSQGPALWAYNNAVFTDKDFENINKLAGGTKVEDLSKIGRFGLGFNAVYHLTDVPSFISRNYLCIFDPNVNHISSLIRDKSRPGISIDLAKNSRPLTAFADQFSLYHEVFGCNTVVNENSNEKFSYQGTLFRFPFRTECEAKKSEMCETVYNFSKVKEIVHTLRRSASLLLLYTQNVKHVELHELVSTGNPQDTTLVLSINKNIQNSNTVSKLSYIQQCSKWWQENFPLNDAPVRLEQITIKETENPSTFTNSTNSLVNNRSWLVAYCVGKDRSITFAREKGQKHGLLPLAATAALLEDNSDDKITAKQIEGEAFCFLPLYISTGLPIHVNSSFAVRSNRDGIWEKTTAEENLESRWNECLLQDAIPEAYLKLLSELVNLSKEGSLLQFDQHFHDFWPRLAGSRTSWTILVSSFYTRLVEQDLKLFCSNGKWINITDGFILDDELRKCHDDHGGVVETLKILGQYVFDLPSDVISAMKSSVPSVLEEQTLGLVSLFERFLFPNLPSIPADIRNPIVHYGLRYIFDKSTEDTKRLKSLYKKTDCISCSSDCETLARPSDLINPTVEIITELYSPEEHRFPPENLDEKQMYMLGKLGMVKELCWQEICGRAKSIEELAINDRKAALRRSQFLIEYLSCNIKRLKTSEDQSNSHILQDIKFLPVRLTPPAFYTLPWKGGEFCNTEFRSSNQLFLPKDDNILIGSSCLIVDDADQSGNCGSLDLLEHVLGFSQRLPSCLQVLQQLEITRESVAEDNLKIKVCKRVYKLLNEELRNNPDVIEMLESMAWLFIDGEFVDNKKIALDWKGNALPFLHTVPDEYKREFSTLLELTNIKNKFTASDFLEALDSLREVKNDSPLAPEGIKLVVTLINELKYSSDKSVKQRVGTIPLPDTKGLLCDSGDLTIPESFDVKYAGNERYIHSDITQSMALKLGARRLRARRREKYGNSLGMSFGQFEKLTDRIKNILKSYPCDVGILKELVQNADDAKATEVQFIYDKRTLAHKRVLQNKANEVQGPALCVYNNKFFSEDDFKGICKLGIGSKQNDPSKTGQYGVGFNAVYHLTDCPSFLSNDDTLCILDPHCKYSPEATQDAPGGKYSNIDNDFKDVFSDTVSGYLGDFSNHFPLKGCTMFRLPLRTEEQSKTSEISRKPVTNSVINHLMREFKEEAKKSLLFLNHVKKIGLWEIDENSELKSLYSVCSAFQGKYQEKLNELHQHLKEHKEVATREISAKDVTYTICVEDKQLKEEWLIHQCFGIRKGPPTDEQTPNVRDLGLFPRGGIAALLPASGVRNEDHVAYCFLPLPVTTSLPVHVNGHFALDGSRRDLWFDQSPTCLRTIWNAFMKKQVLGPAYASLIIKAREQIPQCEKDVDKIYFSTQEDAKKALKWYHTLFPDPTADPKWEALAVAVYQCSKDSEILPVVSGTRVTLATEEDKQGECKSSKSPEAKSPRKCKKTSLGSGSFRSGFSKYSCQQPQYRDTARESNSEQMKTARLATVDEKRANKLIRYYIEWLPPNCVYFTEEEKREKQKVLLGALLRIRMPVLLYTPLKIHDALVKSEVESHVLAPENVIQFLLTWQEESFRCNIGKLPIHLRSSNIQNIRHLRSILEYCAEVLRKSPEHLQGLPLLLTDDNLLRAFSSESPVYCSSFSKLFPDKCFMFVHLDFVPLLSTFCGLESDIICDLTISSLATEFMPDVFAGKLPLGERKHVSWNYPKKGVLSKKWFSRLWMFLQTANCSKENKSFVDGEYSIATSEEVSSTSESNDLVEYLGKYPIIPTTDGKLATVGNAKTVLAVSHYASTSFLKQQVTKILKNLTCPFLDESVTKVALSFVADSHCESDVLHVLDYMNETGILDLNKFDDKSINTLLRFFEDESDNKECMDMAKKLPFYKSVDGGYHALSSYVSSIQVPTGLPHDGIKELQHIHENILFLPPASHLEKLYNLNELYKALGITVDCSIFHFYITYVLPSFSSFSRKCQIEFLATIKDNLRCSYMKNDDLIKQLRSTRCIPDQTENLRVASSYFNPRDELFKVMFKQQDNVFPKAPFCEQDWIDFLVEIGMNKDCDQKQFIKFAREVEDSARDTSDYDQNIATQSKALVTYLLQNCTSWDCSTISQIQFIVPEEVEDELSSLHAQYRVNGKLEFVSYRDSVPWKGRQLVWTSAKLLPKWAYQRNHNIFLSYFKVPSKPSLDSVVKHVKIISKRASELVKSDRPLSAGIIEVFKKIYVFLQGSMGNCAKEPPFSNCNQDCQKIGDSLASVACIVLSKERQLVKGEGLSFEDTDGKLKPHFHMVPKDYFQYEHLLKRLGVTEKLSASQMSNVLESIKDSRSEDTMNSKEEEKACYATSVLFKSLHGDSTEVESRLSNCKELYLPSMNKRLVNSNELVCQVQPRLRESVAKQGHDILYPLEKCGLKRELEGAYLDALPKRLRPTSLDCLVREELYPNCKENMKCIYCQNVDCTFIQKFILVLRSLQFERGILRLLKHQKETSTLEDEDRARAARFTSAKVSLVLWCEISLLFIENNSKVLIG